MAALRRHDRLGGEDLALDPGPGGNVSDRRGEPSPRLPYDDCHLPGRAHQSVEPPLPSPLLPHRPPAVRIGCSRLDSRHLRAGLGHRAGGDFVDRAIARNEDDAAHAGDHGADLRLDATEARAGNARMGAAARRHRGDGDRADQRGTDYRQPVRLRPRRISVLRPLPQHAAETSCWARIWPSPRSRWEWARSSW